MRSSKLLTRIGLVRPWSQEAALAVVALSLGFGAMPALVYVSGSLALGRYEDASLPRLFKSVYAGLMDGSVASWTVVLGPYGFYLLFKILRLWWRVGARTP